MATIRLFVQLGETQTVEHGSAATEPDTTREGYTFKGWDVDFSKVTADLTVTATYEINKYTVTFKDWNGTVLKEETVEYGKGATAPADPTREADENNTYTFKGWDVDFSNVTADLTVTAQYDATPVEPDTEPDTEPETEPETETEPDSGIVVPGTTEEPGTTDEPGDETETEPVPAGCDGSNAWWIILLIVIVLIILALIGYVLYQKGIFAKQIQETLEEEPEVEEEPEENTAPLFIPLGEELPEEEPEEIHVVPEVSVEEVDALMSDATAEHVLEESVKMGGTGRLGIINIGVLHDVYEDGDVVTLEDLKEKDMIADSIGRLKVLASGSLNKALTVEADAFSVQAIKMITLTGGHAVKLRNPGDDASQNQKKRKK